MYYYSGIKIVITVTLQHSVFSGKIMLDCTLTRELLIGYLNLTFFSGFGARFILFFRYVSKCRRHIREQEISQKRRRHHLETTQFFDKCTFHVHVFARIMCSLTYWLPRECGQ